MTTIIQFYAVYMGPVQEHKAMRYLFRRYMPPVPADPPFSLGRDKEPKLWFAPEHPDLGYVTDDQLVFDPIPTLGVKERYILSDITASTGQRLRIFKETTISLLEIRLSKPNDRGWPQDEMIILTDDQRLELIKALEGV